MDRRTFLATSAAATAALSFSGFRRAEAQSRPASTTQSSDAHIAWYDVRTFGVEGRAYNDTASYFHRFPARAKGKVPDPVWNLSRQTAGMSARFETDATELRVRYRLTSENLAMAHMPATGVSGVDVYARHDNGWRWFATAFPKARDVNETLASDLAPGARQYLMHLPLYNGVESLEIGVPRTASFKGLAPRSSKPVLYYGTSIAQGGCASRPGLAYTNILARRLDRPVLNFGFSGNGRMELSVGEILAELDPAVFVLDCLPNCTPEQVAERTEPLVKLLREKHPETPILLVEDRTTDYAFIRPTIDQLHAKRRGNYRKAFDALVSAGVKDLHYLPGDQLLGADGEGTVDGSHPNDLGMVRYADALEPAIRKVLPTS